MLRDSRLIAVVFSLVWAFDGHADVVGLSLRELGQVNAEFFQVETCDLFVEDLRERINNAAFVLDAGDSLLALGVEPEIDLCDGLVREASTHHEARVTGCAAEVQQAAFGEDKDAVAVGENPFVVLRLDFVTLDARNLLVQRLQNLVSHNLSIPTSIGKQAKITSQRFF